MPTIGLKSWETNIWKHMKTFNLNKYSKIFERLTSSQTLSKLKFDLSQGLLEEYKSRFPTRAYLVEEVPLRRLTRSSWIAFQFRTEILKSKDWKYRHNQPVDTEPFNSTCHLCGSQKETVAHVVTTVPPSELAKPEEYSRAATSSQKRTFLLVFTRFSVDPTRPHWATVKTKVLHSSWTHSKSKNFCTARWVLHELIKESEHRDEVHIPLEVFQDTSETLLPKPPTAESTAKTSWKHPPSLVEPCPELSL